LLGEEENNSLINLKLQKLLYYIQAWSWGIHKRPFFEGEFQAWVHGPVNVDIYNRFSQTKYLYSNIDLSDIQNREVSDEISPDDKKYINWILENYAPFSGAELEQISHNETPWIETRGILKPFERCDKVISPKLIQSYYAEKWSTINAAK
ncbi:MAG TPA: hypothetical protein DEQ30_10515, partial [Porphyromonadaceae bacterium]|nr:hypothetical protein [Porphyromonadaceae bacterium]